MFIFRSMVEEGHFVRLAYINFARNVNMNEITLNFACLSYNTYYRIMRGRYIISAKGRAFRQLVKDSIINQPLVQGRIKLEIEFHFRDRRIRDLDNHTKALIDALKGILFVDDSDIFVLNTSKHIGVVSKTIIRISALN